MLASLAAGGWAGIARQFALPLVVWIHACIGLHFAWRLKPWYRAWLPPLYAVALLVPAAGIAGAGVALRDFAELAQQPGFLRELFTRVQAPRRRQRRRALHDLRQPDGRRGAAAARPAWRRGRYAISGSGAPAWFA